MSGDYSENFYVLEEPLCLGLLDEEASSKAAVSFEEYGRVQNWWNNPDKNPVAYFMNRIDKQIDFNFSSKWLRDIRSHNKCIPCKSNTRAIRRKGISQCFECKHNKDILTKPEVIEVTCPKCLSKTIRHGRSKEVFDGSCTQKYKCISKSCRHIFVFGVRYDLELKKEKAVISILAQDYNFSQAEGMLRIPRQSIRKWVVEWLTAQVLIG